MTETLEFTQADDEETLVTPRFDDEETLVAQQVIPLDEAGGTTPHTVAPAHHPDAGTRVALRPAWRRAPRRGWVLALALASAIVGGVLGGAGLYLYQSRTKAAAPLAADSAGTEATDVSSSDAPAPAQPLPEPPTPQAVIESSESVPQAEASVKTKTISDGPKVEKETEKSRVEQRKVSDTSDPVPGRPRRGKKGAQDEELRRRGDDRDGRRARADDDSGERKARRVDTITLRPRRAGRDRAHTADSIRRIFEGRP
jgi:hypothetical protein